MVVVAALMVLAMLVSCTSRGDFSRFRDIDASRGWAYRDTVRFDTQRPDSLAPGSLSVAVRHNNEYQFANLWLEVCYNNRGRLHRDTVNLKLADLYGRWLGKGFGSSRQAESVIARSVLPSPGSEVTVRQIMRVDTLRGVDAVGVIFHAE